MMLLDLEQSVRLEKEACGVFHTHLSEIERLQVKACWRGKRGRKGPRMRRPGLMSPKGRKGLKDWWPAGGTSGYRCGCCCLGEGVKDWCPQMRDTLRFLGARNNQPEGSPMIVEEKKKKVEMKARGKVFYRQNAEGGHVTSPGTCTWWQLPHLSWRFVGIRVRYPVQGLGPPEVDVN